MKKSLQELAQELQQNSQQELQATRENLQSVLTQHETDLKRQFQNVLNTMQKDMDNLARQTIQSNERVITEQMTAFYERLANFQQELHKIHQRQLRAKETDRIPFLEQFTQVTILLIGILLGVLLMSCIMLVVLLIR